MHDEPNAPAIRVHLGERAIKPYSSKPNGKYMQSGLILKLYNNDNR